MKRLARDRYLFCQENQRVTRKRNEGRRRGRGRRRGEKMGDERGDIRTGDEKIKGERGWGMEGGGHTDKVQVWTDVSVYYSSCGFLFEPMKRVSA